MRLLDFFRSKKKDNTHKPITRNVLNLQVNDIVTYDLEDYIVVGKIVYSSSGYEWVCYQLKGDTHSVWLSAEMDDELKMGIYKRVQTKISPHITEKLIIDETTYYLEEHGFATIKKVEGQAGAVEDSQIEYWEFHSGQKEFLSVEKWGNALEVSKGYPITEKELSIIAGSQLED